VTNDKPSLDCELIDASLKKQGYYIIHDAAFASLCEQARAEYVKCVTALPIHAPKEKFHPSVLAVSPWRKLAIGSSNALNEGYAQLLQTTYFHVEQGDTNPLARLFLRLIEVRNTLMGVAPDFGFDPSRDKFWNACRTHHYPRGGGFMGSHRDAYFPLKLGDRPFYQVMALLSRKGTDFQAGGGYVVSRDTEQRIDVETAGGFGAIVVFDGKTVHGVEDVDLDQVLNFNATDGRVAAFANVYLYNP